MVFSSLLSTVSTSIPGQVPAPWSSGLIGGHMKESSCPKLGGVGMSRTFDEVPASPQAANVLPSLMLAEEGDQAATHWGRRLSEAVEQQQDVCMGCSGSDAAEAPGTWQEFCDGFSRWLINEDAAVDRHVELKVHGKGKWDGYFAEAERRCVVFRVELALTAS